MKQRTWLINIRDAKGLTQDQAALLSGISRSALSNIERGKGLSVKLAKRIAKALGFEWQLFFEDKCADTKQKSTRKSA